MTQKEKIDFIQNFNEDDLREKLLIPLFSKMGFIDPIIHHHNNEKGKDIVFKEFDNKFKKTNYFAVVVKAGDVNGSASGNSNYFTLLNQVKQALNEPYKHIYDLKEVNIDQVIIVISGRFLPTSLESIYGTLKAERLDKAIKEPIDINKLVSLVDEYFGEFWEEVLNEKKSLIDQRNYLLNNFSKMTKIIFPEIKDQAIFLKKVASSEIDINLLPYKSITRYVADIGYKEINIDEIDDFYTDSSISNHYCDIKNYFFELKNDAKKILYEMDESIEILKSILNEKNPEKIVDYSNKLRWHIGGYGLQFQTNGIEHQEEYGYALKEYKEKKEYMIENNFLEFYHTLFKQISEVSKKYLVNFFVEHPRNERDVWLGMKVKIDIQKKSLEDLVFYEFTEEPIVVEHSSFGGHSIKEFERSRIENPSIIMVEYALNNYGFVKEEEYIQERRANYFISSYIESFEREFLKLIGYYSEE